MNYVFTTLLTKYPILAEFVLARNIVNTGEIDEYLKSLHVTDMESLNTWLNTAMRKYLINKYDKTRSYKPSADDPSWMQGKEDLEAVVLDDALTTKIQHVTDFLKNTLTTNPTFKIQNFQVDEAFKQAQEWVEKLAKKKVEEEVEGKDFKVLKDYGDGYKWVEVISENGLLREGKIMGHCVGGYWDRVKSGAEKIISLRDSKNEPHATLELERKGTLNQIKGKQNKRVITEYMPYVMDFLNSKVASFNKIADWDQKLNGILKSSTGYIDVNSIPAGTVINQDLDLKDFKDIQLPENLTIKGNLTMTDGLIKPGLKVSGELDLSRNTDIDELPAKLDVGSLNIFDTHIEMIPQGTKIRKSLNAEFSRLSKLPDNFTVPQDLTLSDTPIRVLPKGLKVGHELDLMNTEITILPEDLQVGDAIYLDDDWEDTIEVPEHLKDLIY